MKLIKSVLTPRVTPLTATTLKQVIGGLRGATGSGSKPDPTGAPGSGSSGG